MIEKERPNRPISFFADRFSDDDLEFLVEESRAFDQDTVGCSSVAELLLDIVEGEVTRRAKGGKAGDGLGSHPSVDLRITNEQLAKALSMVFFAGSNRREISEALGEFYDEYAVALIRIAATRLTAIPDDAMDFFLRKYTAQHASEMRKPLDGDFDRNSDPQDN